MSRSEEARDELVLRPPRPRVVQWFAARPRISDIAVILACTAPTVAALILSSPGHAWLGWTCAAGIAVAFWWRRSHPLAVLLIAVSLASLSPVAGNSMSPGFFESAFALYALAARARLPVALLGYLLGEGAIFAVSGLAILLGFRDDWPAVLLQPVSLAAFPLGVAVRASRARTDVLEQVVALREDRSAAAERARITAEMHDVVAHSVTVMIALAGGAAAGWEKRPERARGALNRLGEVGAHMLEEIQRILRVLRNDDEGLDGGLEASGLDLPSLKELAEVFRAAGLPVILSLDTEMPDDPALRTTVHRIVQESLTNALRHSRDASCVKVRIAREGDRLTIGVVDDGRGRPGSSPGAGLGLRAMRERAQTFRGDFAAGPLPRREGAPIRGWQTPVSIPMEGKPA